MGSLPYLALTRTPELYDQLEEATLNAALGGANGAEGCHCGERLDDERKALGQVIAGPASRPLS
jgi:hypothetical protein